MQNKIQNKIQKLFDAKNIPRILLANVIDPRLSLALGNVLFDSEKPSLMINRAKPSVIFGINQNPYIECDIEQIKKDNIVLIRRETGGGTVYLDEGTMMVSFNGNTNYPFFNKNDINEIITNSISKFIQYPAEVIGKNDIKVKIDNTEHKIAGQAFKYSSNYYKHHLSVLVDTNFSAMEKYLKPNKLKIKAKGIKSVKSNVINIVDILKHNTDTSKLCYAMSMTMIKNFLEKFDCTNQAIFAVVDDMAVSNSYLSMIRDNNNRNLLKNFTYISTDELLNNEDIRTNYDQICSEERIFGKTPEFTHQFEKHFAWGSIIIQLNIVKNIIKNVECYTDSIEIKLPKIVKSVMSGVNTTGLYYNKLIIAYHFDCYIKNLKNNNSEIMAGILTDIKNMIVDETVV